MRLSLTDHLIIVLIVVALSISGVSGYLLWSGWPNNQHLTVVRQQTALLDKFERPSATAGPLAQSSGGILSQIHSNKTAGVAVDGRGNILIVEESPARIISLDPNTNHTRVLGSLGAGIPRSVVWSPSRTMVLVEMVRNTASVWSVITIEPFIVSTLPNNTVRAAFSPDETELAIARTGASVQTFEVVIKPLTSTVARPIFTTRAAIAALGWPEQDTLSITLTREDHTGSVFLLSRDGSLAPLQTSVAGAEILWTNLGERALLSWYTDGALQTEYINRTHNDHHALGSPAVSTTCAWLSDEVTVWCPMVNDGTTNIVAIDTQNDRVTTLLDGSARGSLPVFDQIVPIENNRALIVRTADQHSLLKFILSQ